MRLVGFQRPRGKRTARPLTFDFLGFTHQVMVDSRSCGIIHSCSMPRRPLLLVTLLVLASQPVGAQGDKSLPPTVSDAALTCPKGTSLRSRKLEEFYKEKSPSAAKWQLAPAEWCDASRHKDSSLLRPTKQARGPYREFDLVKHEQRVAQGELRRGKPVKQWTFWDLDGKVRASGAFKAGKPHGKWRFWWPSGKLQAAGDLRRGVRSGTWKYYKGTVTIEGRFVRGKRHGAWERMDQAGVGMTAKYRKGKVVSGYDIPLPEVKLPSVDEERKQAPPGLQ